MISLVWFIRYTPSGYKFLIKKLIKYEYKVNIMQSVTIARQNFSNNMISNKRLLKIA